MYVGLLLEHGMYYDTILYTPQVQIAWPGYNILCTHTQLRDDRMYSKSLMEFLHV